MGSVSCLTLFFFFKIVSAIWGPLHVLWILGSAYHFYKEAKQNLKGIAFNLQITWAVLILGSNTIKLFPKSENGRSLHLFRSFRISFNDVLLYSAWKTWTSFLKFISKNLIFDAAVNKKVFWISLLDCSLLIYRNTSDLCTLICILQPCRPGLLALIVR